MQAFDKFMQTLRFFFSDSRKTLFLSFAAGVAFVLLGVVFCESIFRDTAHCYAYEAAAFGRGEFIEALRPELPVLPIALPGLFCLLGLDAFVACKLAGGIFYLLAAMPLYSILKRFFEPKHAAWGVLLYILAPKAIRFSMSGLPDVYRNFFIVLSIALLFEQLAKPKLWKACAFGAALAGVALSRGEGIVIAAFQMAVFLFFVARARWSAGLRSGAFASAVCKEILVAILVFIVCMAPRGVQMTPLCGYPVPDIRLATHINEALGLEEASVSALAPPTTGMERKFIADKKFFSQVDANIRGAYELYAAFAALGAILLIKTRRWTLEHSYFIALILANMAVFATISVSYRYYLVNLQLLMPLTVAGFVWALSWLPRWRFAPALLAVALFGIASAQIANGMALCISGKDAYEREIGAWVKGHPELFRHTGRDGRLRVMGDTELDFWTGGEYVFPSSYKVVSFDYKTIQDFDVALFYVKTRWQPNPLEILESRSDVERLKGTPHAGKVAIYRKLPIAGGTAFAPQGKP